MSAIRPLRSQIHNSSCKNSARGIRNGARGFASSKGRQADFTHAVIGGGAVGLAIARRLARREGSSTVLVERNEAVGMETSSRNSEVGFLIYCGGGEVRFRGSRGSWVEMGEGSSGDGLKCQMRLKNLSWKNMRGT